jgi:hypothetical protein
MALTIHTRRRIFYTLVALFIIIGGGVVSYAQGWRLDFTTWHFEKIGGIYVRAYPENADIYLDGQPIQNQSGFLTAGTLISDLLPRTYTVSLKSAGYDDWQENAPVAPSLVTQYKYAVLVPTDGTTVPSSSLVATIRSLASLQSTSTTFVFNTNTTIASSTIPGKNLKAEWLTPNLVGALQTSGELYLFDPADAGSANAIKLADDVKNFAATGDGSMVAALEEKSLEIFTLADQSNYYRFNLPDIADAQNIIWYKDRAHLFIVYSDRVVFLDLADANLINLTILAHGTKPQYDPSTNTLYITDSATGKLVAYSFPN